MTALTGGAVPLPVPVEVFYKIGQQYIEANAKAFTLTFPPLEELVNSRETATENISGQPGDEEKGEDEEEKLREMKTAEEEGAEENAREDTPTKTPDHSLGSQTNTEANASREETIEEGKEEESMHQQHEQHEQHEQEQQHEQKQQHEQQQQNQQYEQQQQHEQNQQQMKERTREEELLQEVALRARLADALAQQKKVLQAQTQLLAEAVTTREKKMEDVAKELQALERRLSCIALQAENLVTAADENRRQMGQYLTVRIYIYIYIFIYI